MTKPFLTARWINLCMVTYAVDPALVAEHVPAGLVHDELPELPGRGLVSLVAFDFLDTRVLGVRIPGHVNFPEVNLRTYVRDPVSGDQGVSFVREFVPRPAIAWVARWAYNEPYRVAKMSASVQEVGGRILVEHRFAYGGCDAVVSGQAVLSRGPSLPGSRERFLSQRLWGYGSNYRGRTLRYRVEHPVWELYEQPRFELSIDFEKVYGPKWGALRGLAPVSTILAAGSEVTVAPWKF